MLRKDAIIRAAFVTHVTKIMRSGLLTVRACMGVPPVVLHLSLQQLEKEPPEQLVAILSTIYISNPSYISLLSYYNNSIVKKYC